MQVITKKELIKENEKLNHYKLLYQKVKERNDELKTRIQNEKYKNRCHCSSCDYYFLKELEKILEGESNE